jgi:hypothetical protein
MRKGRGRKCKIESTVIAIPFCVEVTHVEFMTVKFSFVQILKRGIEQKLTKVTKEKSGVKERSHGNLRHGQVKTSGADPPTLMAMTIGLLGLDRLRGTLPKYAIRQIHGILPLIRESHPS